MFLPLVLMLSLLVAFVPPFSTNCKVSCYFEQICHLFFAALYTWNSLLEKHIWCHLLVVPYDFSRRGNLLSVWCQPHVVLILWNFWLKRWGWGAGRERQGLKRWMWADLLPFPSFFPPLPLLPLTVKRLDCKILGTRISPFFSFFCMIIHKHVQLVASDTSNIVQWIILSMFTIWFQQTLTYWLVFSPSPLLISLYRSTKKNISSSSFRHQKMCGVYQHCSNISDGRWNQVVILCMIAERASEAEAYLEGDHRD